MKSRKKYIFLSFFILTGLFSLLNAESKRTVPLDMYLIIDGSSSMENSKKDVIAWINEQIIERMLIEGDQINIWSAGDESLLVHSDTVSGEAGKNEIRAKLDALDSGGEKTDFSGALREAASRISRTGQNKMSVTMLITASARGLGSALAGDSQGLFRWFRSEKYERWQVLMIAPNIGPKVKQSALAFMNGI